MDPLSQGAELTSSGAHFRVWAPHARSLTLRLDGRDHAMNRSEDGMFSLASADGAPGSPYSYVFEDGRARPDPASRRQPEGVHAPSQIFDPARFSWGDHGWRGLPLEALVFYELHVGTFTAEGTLDAAARRLEDLAELGARCVELMPVQPFAGPRNWGYDGVLPYAVHEAYGGPEALQRFVDAAHRRGLAVCLDLVFNHFGPEGNYLRDFGPYFSSRHRSPWGDGINYDGPGNAEVRRFAIGAALQWVRDFHVDALRLDAIQAIDDDSSRHLVAELADEIRRFASSAGRFVHVIAESDLNDRVVVDPPPEGWGLAAMWADDFHHAVHAWLTQERARFYADFGAPEQLVRALTQGFAYQGEYSTFRRRAHGTDTRGLAPSRFVFCLQNHDQVGNRPRGERISSLVPWDALPAMAATLLLGPGLPLLFMGEEYGETRPFLYFTSHSDPELARAVTEGRRREFIAASIEDLPDPQDVSTFERSKLTHRRDGPHGVLRDTYRRLLELRRHHQACIATEWPRARVDGRRLVLERSAFELEVNLGPEPSAGLPGWGWRVT